MIFLIFNEPIFVVIQKYSENAVITVNIPQQDINSTNYHLSSFFISSLRNKLSVYFSVINARAISQKKKKLLNLLLTEYSVLPEFSNIFSKMLLTSGGIFIDIEQMLHWVLVLLNLTVDQITSQSTSGKCHGYKNL